MRQHNLFWGSSYDRGLDILLYMWGDILKVYPDAQLHVTYGWDLFLKVASDNPERMQWYKTVNTLLGQKGITHYGRVGKDKLKEIREKCGIWAYPTYFEEINCITALECQNQGLVPVAMAFGALKETAKSGILIEGDIKRVAVYNEFKKQLLDLMGDKKRWKDLSGDCRQFAKDYDWSVISEQWEFYPEFPKLKITVYTPTIREGFWNLMASNLKDQTYFNFEWLIVDDHKEDRSKIAKKYAKKYTLDIKYIRNRKHKRKYGLSTANNVAIENATGELFVALQDFVILQPTALEELARESLRHPGDLIAPVDTYYKPKIKPDVSNKEDWFNGETEIVGEYMRKNVRIQGQGLRETSNPYDFELNIGAIPMSTLKELNGFWEFMGDALGYDNTEIAWRALQLGHKIWIDEWNIAICIDHWEVVGNNEGGLNRTRLLNDPRYYWLITQTEAGKLPVKRDVKIDNSTSLDYEIPKEVTDEECKDWIRKNYKQVAEKWL